MGTITSYITDLVHLHDCVIVPGLGAFVGNYKPSEINQEKGLFFPPKKEIGFNRSLQHNDGLLYDYIARCEGLSFNDAKKMAEAFVSDTVAALTVKQIVTIGDIGELKKDAMGNILFWPNTSALLLPESFGLAPFHFAQAQHKAMHQQKLHPSTVWMRRISQRQWVASIALFAGLFLLNNELKTPYTVSTGTFVPSFATTNEPLIEEVSAVDASEFDATTSLTESAMQEQPEPKAVDEPNGPSYYLVAASFPSASAANKHKELLVKSGYANCDVLSTNGKNRVTIERFTSRDQAFTALENFRQIKGFETAWLLKEQ